MKREQRERAGSVLPTTPSSKPVVAALRRAGIELNGPEAHDLQIHDQRFFGAALRDGPLGFGESYMHGWWTTDGSILHLPAGRAAYRGGIARSRLAAC